MPQIKGMFSREILDSRGWPTVEVDMLFDTGHVARAAVPSGASTGRFEAVELRDGEEKRYLGRGVCEAVQNVVRVIQPRVVGFPLGRQEEFDRILIDLDGTENKGRLGANALLAVSLAYAKGSAAAGGTSLYRLVALLNGKNEPADLLPVPLMNVINGGRHADNPLDIQEFMIVPCGPTFRESLRMGVEVFQGLKEILKGRKMATSVGDEGGFAPALDSNRLVLEVLSEAVRKAGHEKEVFFALDCASSEFHSKGRYRLRTEEGEKATREELVSYYRKLIDGFPVVSIEDGMAEEDWEGWKALTAALGGRIQLVGDDLFVTNPKRLEKGIQAKVANAILIKLNQIGTLSETLAAVRIAKDAGYGVVISHRSGETEDATIADLAVGCGAGQIKAGGPSRSERLAKYNQLLRIEEELGSTARYLGKKVFHR